MAVTSVKKFATPSGETGKREDTLTITYRVDMEQGDGVTVALQAAGLPSVGDFYEFNGQTYPALHNGVKRARMVKATPPKAYVDCEFVLQFKEPDEPGDDGGPVEDPNDVQPVLIPGYRTVNEVIRNAEFIAYVNADGDEITPDESGRPPGEILGGSGTLTAGDKRSVSNSAWIPYVPAPEEPKGLPILTLKKYYRTWFNGFDDAVTKSNSASYQINFIDGSGVSVYNRTFAAETLFLSSIEAEQRQFESQIWYWLTFEFWIDPDGWFRDFADQGITEIDWDYGTKSGKGHKPIKSVRGNNVNDPVNLDGYGRAASAGDDPIYLRWRTKQTYNFDLLGLTY